MANNPGNGKNLGQEEEEETSDSLDFDLTSSSSSSSSSSFSFECFSGDELDMGSSGCAQGAEKKRGRIGEDLGGLSSGGGDQKRRKGKQILVEHPEVEPKALFGHMKTRKKGITIGGSSITVRGGGAARDVPREIFQELLVPALINIAQAMLLTDAPATAPPPPPSSSSRAADYGLDQPGQGSGQEEEGRDDLNKPPQQQQPENKDCGGDAAN